MEKYTMFMDRKNQYSGNEYTTQSNLQIQCNPFQATSDIFHRTRTNNFHSLLWWTIFSQTSPPWSIHLGGPYTAWLSFTELDKAVVWVIRLASCLWLCFHLSALWCPLSVPTILLGFLLPWTWGFSSRPLQQTAAATPYLGCGVTPLSHCSWPWMWGSSSWPCCHSCYACVPLI